MRASLLIAKRELGAYFYSPVFYVITTVFLFIYGFMFFSLLNIFSAQSMQAAALERAGLSLSVNKLVVEPSLSIMAMILLFIIPIITMRSFAEEKKSKTFPLLLSSPVPLSQIVFGKFLACLTVVFVMLLLSSYSMILIVMLGTPEIGPILSGYLGILMMSGCFVAMGVLASSLTDNQIIAAVISFGFALFMFIIGWAVQIVGPDAGAVFEYIALASHLESFLMGALDSSDLVYYLSFIGFGLFLTHRILDSRRWR